MGRRMLNDAEYSRGAVTSYSYEGPRSAHDDASQGRPSEDRSHIRVPGATLIETWTRVHQTLSEKHYQEHILLNIVHVDMTREQRETIIMVYEIQ